MGDILKPEEGAVFSMYGRSSGSSGKRLRGALAIGPWIFYLAIAISSVAGALVFPISRFGRTSLHGASKEWLILLVLSWALLTAWALAFAWLLRSRSRFSYGRSLLCAAACQAPLLVCWGLVWLLYENDAAYHAYENTAYGQVIFQPVAQGYVLLAPALFHGVVLTVQSRQRLARLLPVASVTLIALFSRLWGLDWGLPALYHPDEHHYLGQASVMLASGDLNPHYFENPSLLIYVIYLLDRILPQQEQAFHVVNDFFNLGIMDPRGDYLVDLAARGVSAISGTMTVLLVYVIGEALFNRAVALFASSLMAVSFLHVRNSHYATNDVFATLFLVASFLFAVRIYRNGRIVDYVLAGLVGGLGTSAKYNMGVFLVAVLVAHVVRVRKGSYPGRTPQGHSGLLLAAAASVAGFVLGTPYSVLDWPGFLYGFLKQYGFGREIWTGQEDAPSLLSYLKTLVQGFGVMPLVLSAAGVLILGMGRDRTKCFLVTSVPAVYLAFMATQRLFFARFAIPILPFLALLAGYTLAEIYRKVGRRRSLEACSLLLVGMVMAQPAVMSWQHNLLLRRDDTRAMAVRWIESNVSSEDVVAVEAVSKMNSPFGWRSWQMRGTPVFVPGNPQDEVDLFNGKIRYAIVTSYGYDSPDKSGKVRVQPLYDRLEREASLVATFRPGAGDTDLPYALDDAYGPFWHLFDRQLPGPTVKIYRLP